jgi:hypothetical protein
MLASRARSVQRPASGGGGIRPADRKIVFATDYDTASYQAASKNDTYPLFNGQYPGLTSIVAGGALHSFPDRTTVAKPAEPIGGKNDETADDRCSDITIGPSIFYPGCFSTFDYIGEIWTRVIYSTNLDTNRPGGWGCINNPDKKGFFELLRPEPHRAEWKFGTYGILTRMQTQFTFGQPADVAPLWSPASPLNDGTRLTICSRFRTNIGAAIDGAGNLTSSGQASTALVKVSVTVGTDGPHIIADATGLDVPYVFAKGFKMGGNLNGGPADGTRYELWESVEMWIGSDPGIV